MKRLINLLLFLSFSTALMAQQKPIYEQTHTPQVLSNWATWSRYFMGVPKGGTPSFPYYVPDSVKCGALFLDTLDHHLYYYDCHATTWKKIADSLMVNSYAQSIADSILSGQKPFTGLTSFNNGINSVNGGLNMLLRYDGIEFNSSSLHLTTALEIGSLLFLDGSGNYTGYGYGNMNYKPDYNNGSGPGYAVNVHWPTTTLTQNSDIYWPANKNGTVALDGDISTAVPFVSALSYVTDTTGTTDQTTNLQAAIDATPEGGELFIPQGRIKFSKVHVTQKITIQGTGGTISADLGNWNGTTGAFNQAGTQLISTAVGDTAIKITAPGVDIDRINFIDGNGATPIVGSVGISFTNAGSFRFTRSTIQGYYNQTNVVNGLFESFDKDIFAGMQNGAVVFNSPLYPDDGDWALSNCTIVAGTNSTASGIIFNSSGGGKVTNTKWISYLNNHLLYAIKGTVTGSTGQLMISNSSAETSTASAFYITTSGASFSDIQFSNVQIGEYAAMTGHPIWIVGHPGHTITNVQLNNITITDNGSNTGKSAIEIDTATNVQSNNIIAQNWTIVHHLQSVYNLDTASTIRSNTVNQGGRNFGTIGFTGAIPNISGQATGSLYYLASNGQLAPLGIGAANSFLMGGTTPIYSTIGQSQVVGGYMDNSTTQSISGFKTLINLTTTNTLAGTGVTNVFTTKLPYSTGNEIPRWNIINGSGVTGIAFDFPLSPNSSSYCWRYGSVSLGSGFNYRFQVDPFGFAIGNNTTNPMGIFEVDQPTYTPGEITVTATGTTVTGTGTEFTNTFKIGDQLTANGEMHTITAIASNNSMTTDAWTNAATNVVYTVTGGNRFRVYGNGLAAIGGNTPTAFLDIPAGSSYASMRLRSTSTTPNNQSGHLFNLNNILTYQDGTNTYSLSPSATNDLTSQTTIGNISSVTSVGSTATYVIDGYLNVTAISTDVIQAQCTYTDENNNAQTLSFSNISTTGNNSFHATIRAKASTAITLKTNLSTGGGTVTFDAGGYIKKAY
jgi:hypothetical protein